jgi:hypothetical protein
MHAQCMSHIMRLLASRVYLWQMVRFLIAFIALTLPNLIYTVQGVIGIAFNLKGLNYVVFLSQWLGLANAIIWCDRAAIY